MRLHSVQKKMLEPPKGGNTRDSRPLSLRPVSVENIIAQLLRVPHHFDTGMI